ncbi:MAG: hypothetical protein ACSHYA_13740 [Opitutaceae bacterium]
MPSNYLKLIVCLLLFTLSAKAGVEIIYQLDSFNTSSFSPTAKEIEAELTALGITVDELNLRNSDVLVRSSIESHRRIFEQLSPEGNWVSGYLYFKVSRIDENGTTDSIRYYTQLPHSASGRLFSESLHFELEPIYTTDDLHRVAPELPKAFDANISYTPNVEDSKVISLICEIQSKELPNISTEFSTLSDELLDLGGVSVVQNQLRMDAQWQCRLFTHRRDPEREALKRKVQSYLDAPRSTSDTESQQLENFFAEAGVDFKSHPKNNLIFDGENMILRLPPAEMAKARTVIANYNEIRQSTVSICYSHESDAENTAIYMSALCLSGKRSQSYAPNLSLFGYTTSDPDNLPRMEIASVTNLNDDDITDLIFEPRAANLFGQSTIETSQEVSLPSDIEIQAAHHQITTPSSTESWTLGVSSRRHTWGRHENEDIITEFFPVSRRALISLTGQADRSPFGPVDPFAAPTQSTPTKPTKNEEAIIKALQQTWPTNSTTGLPQNNMDLVFDGEQLIVTASYETITHLKQQLLKLNYEAPVVGTLQLSYENEAGEEVSYLTSLASDSGKRSTFTIRKEATSDPTTANKALSGTKMILSPNIYETEGRRRLNITADLEWKTKLTNQNKDWWITLDRNSGETFKAKQFLPPISEHTWSLNSIQVFDK